MPPKPQRREFGRYWADRLEGRELLPRLGQAAGLQQRERAGEARFTIPAGAQDVWLASDAARAMDVGRGADWRSLGVCVLNLTLDDGFSPPRAISLEDPLLDEGFHSLERDGERVWRWTNGLTRLPAALWADCHDGCFLRLDHTNEPLPHWIAPAGEAGQSDAPFLQSALTTRAYG